MKPYIEEFLISLDNKNKLDRLDLDTPQALLSMIKHNPYAIEQLIGKKDLEHIETHLWSKIPLSILTEDKSISFPIMSSFFTENEPPALPHVKYDIEQRDQLFLHLQNLRQNKAPTMEELEEITQLEHKIIKLMNSED